jgi:transposase-like protein
VAGVVGRESGHVRLQVIKHTDRETLQPFVEKVTAPTAAVYTDEWHAYAQLPETGRHHATVCHTPGKRKWARDDDGDGVREVHDNTLEGIWTGLRNFLRPFRGLNKTFLGQYIAIFQWGYNLKTAADDFLKALLGVQLSTA